MKRLFISITYCDGKAGNCTRIKIGGRSYIVVKAKDGRVVD